MHEKSVPVMQQKRYKVQTREQIVIEYIINFTKERGYPPSVREIGEVIGVSSSSTVHKFIKQCVKNELIIIDSKISRSIRVLPAGKKLIKTK